MATCTPDAEKIFCRPLYALKNICNMKINNNYWYLLPLAMCLVACTGKDEKKSSEALDVTTETVAHNTHEGSTAYVGTVEESTAIAVSFTGMGTIRQVLVSEGEKVRKGQLLAEMDQTQAQNALATAQASHKQATDALNRMRQLHENKSLADMQWVEVQSKVEQAEALVATAEKMLQDCKIYSPIDGVVGSKKLNAGETALPSQPVVTVLDISRLKVKVSIPENEIAAIAANTQSVIAIDALRGQAFAGGRIEKGVVADASTHTYDIRINIANPNANILPGMVAKVEILSDSTAQGLYLPVRAIQQSADGKHFLWTVQQGRAHRKDVQLGTTWGDRIQVLHGIDLGDEVIVSGYQKVSQGTPVR